MYRRKPVLTALAACLAVALACASNPADPLSPSSGSGPTTSAADGSTLKVGAPTLISPLNDQQPNLLTLTAAPADPKFVAPSGLQYNFEIYSASSVRVANDTVNAPSDTVATPLEFGKRYTWRVRATLDGANGPWSTTGSFIAPAGGYNIPGELYDPLINGRTLGTIHGLVDFIPGVGIKLLDNGAYVDYQLPATIDSGEISAVVTNICSCSGQPGLKTRIFSMSRGYDDMTTNGRRFTVEKRSGADKGLIAWRVITSSDQIETVGSERSFVNFDFAKSYLFRATWGSNRFNLQIDELGGTRVYEFGKSYSGTYNPNPHIAFLGAPDSSSGRDSQTVAGMIIRQFWVSGRPRLTAITQ